jgi:hypothetical protein
MDSKFKLQILKKESINIISKFIDGYLQLCKTDNERLFLSSILYYLLDSTYSYSFNTQKNYKLYCFDYFHPIQIWKDDLNFNLEGIELSKIIDHITSGFTEKKIYEVYPNKNLEIGSTFFFLDFAIFYDIYKDQKVINSKKVAIFCNNVKNILGNEDLSRDSILKENGWTIYKLTDDDIIELTNPESLEKFFNDF